MRRSLPEAVKTATPREVSDAIRSPFGDHAGRPAAKLVSVVIHCVSEPSAATEKISSASQLPQNHTVRVNAMRVPSGGPVRLVVGFVRELVGAARGHVAEAATGASHDRDGADRVVDVALRESDPLPIR